MSQKKSCSTLCRSLRNRSACQFFHTGHLSIFRGSCRKNDAPQNADFHFARASEIETRVKNSDKSRLIHMELDK